MANWDLGQIRNKVRRTTGRLTSREISDQELDNYINQYYQFTFPADVKLERAHTFYEILTEANVQSYTLPDGYTNFEPPGMINYQQIEWYQDPNIFYFQNPVLMNQYTLATGDGTTTAFASTLTNFPVLPQTAIITDNVETFEDTNSEWTTSNVNLVSTGAGSATINYETGAVSVSFATAPANGQAIYVTFANFVAGMPTSVLLYNNKFTFYPVPVTSYRFKCKAYANVLVRDSNDDLQPFFSSITDRPLLDEWGPAIAYGTSRDIQISYGEMDSYAETTALYKEQISYILRRTNQNLLNVRSQPQC